MEGWKTKCLSLAGRVTLASSVITSLPTYHMQTVMMPESVIKEIDKYTRQCVWGSTDGNKKLQLVDWKMVCKAKRQGGLGLRHARLMNKALITRSGWRLLQEPNTLWNCMLRAKYGEGRSSIDMLQSKTSASHKWQGVVKCTNLIGKSRWMVGNVRKVNFWLDVWIDNSPLKAHTIMSLTLEELRKKVVDYWIVASGWDWSAISSLIPMTMVLRLALTIVSMDSE